MVKKIRVEDLEIGMYVVDFNVPWVDHPFLTSRKLIKKSQELDLMRKHNIREVYIDTEHGRDSPRAVAAQEAQSRLAAEMQREVLVEGEGPEPEGPEAEAEERDQERRAGRLYDDAKAVVGDVMGDLRQGREPDLGRAVGAIDALAETHARAGAVLSDLARLKVRDQYLLHHSVNVCILSMTLGRHLGLARDELRRLGLGALLHDIGKLKIPDSAYDRPGGLSEREFALMKTHPLHGAKMILASPEVPDACATIALDHHERYGGGGYPRGLEGLAIGKFGLIAAIADVYDAITTDRVYRGKLAPHVAMQRMYEWAKTDFHPLYAQKFIQCLGIYPVGTTVCLDTGEVAVVTRQNGAKLLRPRVRVVLREGMPLAPPRDLDLARCGPGPDGEAPRITRAVPAEEFGIDPDAVLGAGRARRAA